MITRSGTVEICEVRAGSKLVSYNGMTIVLHPEEPAKYIHFDVATGKGELRVLEPAPVDFDSP